MARTIYAAAVLILVILLAGLAGCASLPTPQAELSVSIEAESMLPATWRIPAGQQITIHFANHSASSCEWTILVGDNALDPNAAQKPAEYWKYKLTAGANETAVFKAPAAAAAYRVMCAPGLLSGKELTGRLIVVQLDDPTP